MPFALCGLDQSVGKLVLADLGGHYAHRSRALHVPNMLRVSMKFRVNVVKQDEGGHG